MPLLTSKFLIVKYKVLTSIVYLCLLKHDIPLFSSYRIIKCVPLDGFAASLFDQLDDFADG